VCVCGCARVWGCVCVCTDVFASPWTHWNELMLRPCQKCAFAERQPVEVSLHLAKILQKLTMRAITCTLQSPGTRNIEAKTGSQALYFRRYSKYTGISALHFRRTWGSRSYNYFGYGSVSSPGPNCYFKQIFEGENSNTFLKWVAVSVLQS
jgi:hypothetical protein